MDRREEHVIHEIEGYAESVQQILRHESLLTPELHEGRIYWMSQTANRPSNSARLVAYLLCSVLRMLTLIFLKLDSVDTHLLEHTLRERNKEGRT